MSILSICGFIAVLSLLFLIGVWIHERLPRWRAEETRARREPLTEDQFGEKFFAPDQARLAARLRRVAADQLNKDLTQLHPDDSLALALFDGSDSLDSVELLMAIEREFGIELDDATAEKTETFRDLVNAVAARRPFLVEWRQRMARATEERFGVSLPREVLAKVATPMELADAVAAALKDQIAAQKSCQNQHAFYQLRSTMIQTWNLPRSLITPTTPLRTLLHGRTARARWTQLRDALTARKWPPLVRPPWMNWLVYGGPLLAAAALAVWLPVLADWVSARAGAPGLVLLLASELRGFVLIPFVILSWVLLVRVSRRFAFAFPRTIRTVADLLPFVVTSPGMIWTREQIAQQVDDVVLKQLRLPPERYRPGARFVEEFQMDIGLENCSV